MSVTGIHIFISIAKAYPSSFGKCAIMRQSPANEGGDQVTTEERKREIFAQPSAAKEAYVPEDHNVNGHIIVRGPDGLWHLFYEPAYPDAADVDRIETRPGRPPSSFDHATSDDLLTWTHHGTVVEAGGSGDCDAYEVGDGCIIEHEGRWHLVYQARPYDGASRRFAMAVSDDL